MTDIIINLTQHVATPKQIEVGVIEPDAEHKEKIRSLLTFDEMPSDEVMKARIFGLLEIAHFLELEHEADGIMIGGAPLLMPALETALKTFGHRVVYAFSKRESADAVQPDGSVKKVSVFKHAGFYESFNVNKIL